MSKHFEDLISGLGRLSDALQTMGGRQPLAIEVDFDTWTALRDMPEARDATRWDGPTKAYRLEIYGVEFRPSREKA